MEHWRRRSGDKLPVVEGHGVEVSEFNNSNPWSAAHYRSASSEKCAATCGHHVIKCPCAVSSNNGVTTIRAGDQQIGICGIITPQFQPSLLVPSHHSPTFHSP